MGKGEKVKREKERKENDQRPYRKLYFKKNKKLGLLLKETIS